MAIVQLQIAENIDAENPVIHDLKLTNGRLSFATGVDAIAQKLRIRLAFFEGEWFLDQREGFPYYRKILIKNPDISTVERLIRNAISSSPGIASVQSVSVSIDSESREMSISGEAITDDGQEVIFGPYIVNP